MSGIELSANFDVKTALPLDSRDVVADIAARDAIDLLVRYQTMMVKVLDDGTGSQKLFWLVGGTDNAHWEEFSSGGGGGGSSDGDDVGEVFASVRRHDDPPENTLYCGGTLHNAVDFPELAQKLWDTTTSKWKYGGTGTYPTGTFYTPNMPGRIMRAVANGSTQDPDRATRVSSAPGGNTGDNVGSGQGYATRAPTTPFSVSNPGNHNHTMMRSNSGGGGGVQIGDNSSLGQSSTVTSDAGSHTHTVTGGDSETRMVNVYFNFFIRTKPSKVGKRGGILHTGSVNPNTLTFDPEAMLGDLYVQSNGDVWEFDGTTWIVSATNLRGPQGYQGGILSVVDLTARDAIPAPDRYEGMPVFVQSNNKNYQLVDGLTNSDWKEFAGDTSMTVSAEQNLANAAAITIADVREQRIKIKGATLEAIVTLPNGNRDGDKVYCVGTSNSSPCIIATGGNVRGFGDTVFYLGTAALYVWDATDLSWDVFKGA